MKAIFFDIGGVIIDDQGIKESVYKAFNVKNRDEFWLLINKELLPAARGERKLYECWRKVSELVNVELSIEVLQSLWIDDFKSGIKINYEMINLVKELKDRYKIGVISNTIHEHATILRDLGIYDHFHDVILSHEVKMAKDNPRIFEIALERLDVNPEESIFIDDVDKFVQIANGLGMKGLLFSSAEKLQNELSVLLNPS